MRCRSLLEFQEFAEKKGYKVDNDCAIFKTEFEALRFQQEASNAGYDAFVESNQVGIYIYSENEDISKLPKPSWRVRFSG